MKALLGAALVGCAACSAPGLAGGALVAPGSEPSGATIARFNLTRCEDGRGARVPEPESRVSLVRMPDARLVLVERRPGYDSLVIENGWDDGDTKVFQLALKRAASGPYLREYRVPISGTASGRVSVIRRVVHWGDASRGFHAVYEAPSVSCDLTPA